MNKDAKMILIIIGMFLVLGTTGFLAMREEDQSSQYEVGSYSECNCHHKHDYQRQYNVHSGHHHYSNNNFWHESTKEPSGNNTQWGSINFQGENYHYNNSFGHMMHPFNYWNPYYNSGYYQDK